MIKKIYKTLLPETFRLSLRKGIQKIIWPWYIGNKFYCNCCNKSFRKFLIKGRIPRKNAKCPYCSSLERVRLLDYYLSREMDVYSKKDFKILHFSPEEGLYNKLKKSTEVYIDGDINSAYANHVIDITNIPYEDDYFDLILCSHVLGHVYEEAKALEELYRVLKKGGIALILGLVNPEMESTFEEINIQSPADRLKNYGEPDLCRLYGMDWDKRIAKAGFEVKLIDYRKSLPKEILEQSSLGDGQRELIWHCQK